MYDDQEAIDIVPFSLGISSIFHSVELPCQRVVSDNLEPVHAADSQNNAIINRNPGKTIRPKNRARFASQMSGLLPPLVNDNCILG